MASSAAAAVAAASSRLRAPRRVCDVARILAPRLPAASRRAAPLAPAAARHFASLGVDSLSGPEYSKVPFAKEDPARVWAEMPDLALSGPKGPQSAAALAAGRLTMDTAAPLDEVVAREDAAAVAAAASLPLPEIRFGELENGVRIAAIDKHGMCASVGLFVHAGSRYESVETACIPHVLELMAFRSTRHLSHLRTLKTLEQLGAAASCRVGREDIIYQFDALREYVPVVLPLMLANVLCPSILEEEVVAAREQAKETILHMEENVDGLLSELLHVAAYKDNTLGFPLYAEEKDIPKFTVETVRNYIQSACSPDRLILVGVNTDFDDLCKWTARSFAEVGIETTPKQHTSPTMPPAVYTGGEQRVSKPNPLCHLMLGWEVEGGWNGPMLAAVTVLQMFLGGGGSFSTGGPGKGMHTRLYTEVLNRHHWVESCQASSVMYVDSGLFTVYATVVPQHAGDFVNVIARIFSGLTRISPEELQRAKNQLKSSIHMNLEMRAVTMEDIGRQLVLSGKVGTAQEFAAIVDAITVQDLLECLRRCLKTELTLVAYGAIDSVPPHEKVKQTIQKACP